MKTTSSSEVTQLLRAWADGEQEALNKLIPLVYQELHRLAARYMRKESPNHTLQTSALVNEAYLRLVDQKKVRWQNRAHFFGVAAQLMRRILVDHARTRASLKRGAGMPKLSLNETAIITNDRAAEFLQLDEALTSLSEFDPRKSRIVEMKIFGGLKTEEIAEIEKVSADTIEREWRKAKLWLQREMQ
jgi:RNA polymerase sigma factor (TIGR02999 family)